MAVNLNPPDPAKLKAVAGVELSYAEAGIRKQGRRDLMLMRFASETRVAGVFTQNGFAAAPVCATGAPSIADACDKDHKKAEGVIEATEERRPPHFHVAVFPDQYTRYVSSIGTVRIASATGPSPARSAPASSSSARGSSRRRVSSFTISHRRSVVRSFHATARRRGSRRIAGPAATAATASTARERARARTRKSAPEALSLRPKRASGARTRLPSRSRP